MLELVLLTLVLGMLLVVAILKDFLQPQVKTCIVRGVCPEHLAGSSVKCRLYQH